MSATIPVLEGQTSIDEFGWVTAEPDPQTPRRRHEIGVTVSRYDVKAGVIHKAYLWTGAQDFFRDHGSVYVQVQYRPNPEGGLPLAVRLVGLKEKSDERALKIRKDGGLVGTLWRRLGFTGHGPVRIDLRPEDVDTPVLTGEITPATD